MEAVVFFISAAIILAGGIGVIVVRNPVHAALSLVMTLFGVAVLFINLEAYFLAVVQVIVYAGAIVVLFLFVIMLVGVDKAEDVRSEPLIGQREFAVLAGIGLVALAVIIGFAAGGEVTGDGDPGFEIARAFEDVDDVDNDGITDETIPPSQGFIDESGAFVAEDSGNTKQLGRLLFTDYVFAFEITALLLTIAVVGAVVLARRPKGELEPIPEVEPAWPVRPEPEPEATADVDDESDDNAADESDEDEADDEPEPEEASA